MLQPDDIQQITAAIIAGGKSSRFGKQKAQATLNGMALIGYALAIARQISQKIIIIAAHNSDYCEWDYPVYADLIPECGPIGGLFTALSYAKTPTIATFSCDLPLIPPEIYLVLKRFQREDRPVVAVSHERMEPLVALWPKNALKKVECAVRQQQFKLHTFLKEMQAIEVSIPDYLPGYSKNWFANINTQDDLKKIESGSYF